MLLDVAVWPMILIGAGLLIGILVVVAALIVLAVFLIRKAKRKENMTMLGQSPEKVGKINEEEISMDESKEKESEEKEGKE